MDNLCPPIDGVEGERIGGFLFPKEPALFAIKPDAQAVHFADFDLAREEHATRAILIAEQHRAIIIDRATGNDRCEVRQNFSGLEAGDEFGELECVSADVADAAAGARACRVGSPFGLLAFGSTSQPTLRIFHHDLANFAQRPGGHPGTGFAHQRIARVGVGQAIRKPGLRDAVRQLSRFGKGCCRWLVANDGNTRRQRRACRGQVVVVGRDDRDKVDPVVARLLGSEHRIEVGISARRINPICLAASAAARGVA